jgi:uncharacterized OB-fold protein
MKEKIKCSVCGWLIVPDEGRCPECGCVLGDDLEPVEINETSDADPGL